jgi:hypothetical protein
MTKGPRFHRKTSLCCGNALQAAACSRLMILICESTIGTIFYQPRIDSGIAKECDFAVLPMSKHSLASPWGAREIYQAINDEIAEA